MSHHTALENVVIAELCRVSRIRIAMAIHLAMKQALTEVQHQMVQYHPQIVEDQLDVFDGQFAEALVECPTEMIPTWAQTVEPALDIINGQWHMMCALVQAYFDADEEAQFDVLTEFLHHTGFFAECNISANITWVQELAATYDWTIPTEFLHKVFTELSKKF